MGISQIILLSILGINLMIESYKHGKVKEGKHNVFIAIVGVFIHLVLLYFGGFFD
jgi:hypothetical protein